MGSTAMTELGLPVGLVIIRLIELVVMESAATVTAVTLSGSGKKPLKSNQVEITQVNKNAHASKITTGFSKHVH